MGKPMGKAYVRWCPRERNRVQIISLTMVCVGDISIVFIWGLYTIFLLRLGGTTYSR